MATIDINEVRALRCADIEIYVYKDKSQRLHTDFIQSLDISLSEVDGKKGDLFVMDEEEYNETILANGGEYADFEGWYGDSNAKVCVIILYKRFELEDIAQGLNLEIVNTTAADNGYPECIQPAIVGFDNFAQAEALAKEYDLHIITLHKRDGWELWTRGDYAYEPLRPTANWYGDDSYEFSSRDYDNYFAEEVRPTLEYTESLEELEDLIKRHREIMKEIQAADEDQLVIVCDGYYYETIDKEVMQWSYDTHNYAIAIL